jgi:hypothetical protein
MDDKQEKYLLESVDRPDFTMPETPGNGIVQTDFLKKAANQQHA